MGPPRPPVKTPSPSATPHPSAPPTPNNTHSPLPAPSPRPSAPYRPGFQPKGVYRPRTDEFVEACRAKRDVGRIEHTKLERRLEKLINLHFSSDEKRAVELGRPAANRRASSFFDMDFSDLKSMDAGELWRGVLQSPALQGSKADIRAAEQRITPWQDDSTVTKCPLCTASFHPLTNRKHHCRLCGQIICSLPVKRPQRPVPCSILFVVDPRTRRIEEVGEGVDYGVRKRRSTPPQPAKGKAKDDALGDEEKFLKGVRICNQCRPVLLRQQYQHETVHVPTFAKLYDAFIKLEHEIEESLPQFQELIVSLSHDDQPTKEASAARKRILEAFAQYDALSKRIRRLPCPSGPGSSQDRVQMAIVTRASIFLQKNMFPLQSLPKSKSKTTPAASPDDAGAPLIDPDSELAHTLQPLLEQEALLESFVEEAKAHRKFEDAKTLKTNLAEIRTEIDRIMANAEGGMTRGNGSARK
ncbi:hypothetical protein PLICRDRAFT_110137 [Plicaturopsis crispa FD-325 SS-3]|nr:hypothetical protein PLICRDRAFT_110137 [Plicaturopsis crispa FD-325 SS-3]